MSARSQRVMEVFAVAVERADLAREQYLTTMCSEDADLRREVEALLAAHAAAERDFPEPAPAFVREEQPGDRVGPYRLLEVIGEGGFGVVWMAEQQRPIRRKVALKLLKAGMDTAQVVARFEAERQALALMDHPNIAKVLDAGATEAGRPYFAMELVRGVPITRFCDEARMSPQERLRLFVPVCEAVQHAHHKGVIHRDIKPSNVLVTLHDGKPVPKVIDFGIAKATSGQLTDRTVFTGFRQMLGTPEYMAPEQAEMSGLDVDTRADVYSLGVVLYELLTGTKPFELKELIEAGYQELLRRIREVEPQKPSTRVSTLGVRCSEIAVRRRMLPKGLSSAFRGDVDWIVLKAMEKERGRRYETPHALAEDLERHLRDDAVLAGPPSRIYRLRKYVRRHKLGVVAVAFMALALIAGTALAGVGYREARAQEGRASAAALNARTAAARATRVNQLVRSLLNSGDPNEKKGPDYTVRQLLDEFDSQLAGQLDDEPEVEAEVRLTLASSFIGLGLPERAAEHLSRALELSRGSLGEGSVSVAENHYLRAVLLRDEGRHAEALSAIQAALPVYRSASNGPSTEVAGALGLQADILLHLGRMDEASAARREALETWTLLEVEPAVVVSMCSAVDELVHRRAAEGAVQLGSEALERARQVCGERDPVTILAMRSFAAALGLAGQLERAEELLSDAHELQLELFGPEHPWICLSQSQLAEAKLRLGDVEGAEALAREAVELGRRALGSDHHRMGALLLPVLVKVSIERGRFGEGAALAREMLDVQARTMGETHPMTVGTRQTLALCLMSSGAAEEALRTVEDGLRAGLESLGEGDPTIAALRMTQADIEVSQNELATAEAHYRQAITAFRNSPPHARFLGYCLLELGILLLDGDVSTRRGEAESLLRESIQAYAEEVPPHVDALHARNSLARALILQDKGLAEAEALLVEALDGLSRVLGDAHRDTDSCRARLGELLCNLGRAEEAESLLRTSAEVARGAVPFDAMELTRALCRLGRCLLLLGRVGEAECTVRECVGLHSPTPPDNLYFRYTGVLGGALSALGRLDEAEPLLIESALRYNPRRHEWRVSLEFVESAVRLCQAWRAPEAPLRPGTRELSNTGRMRVLAHALLLRGRPRDAETLLSECIARHRERPGADPTEAANSLALFALVCLNGGRHGEAELLARECLALREASVAETWQHYNALAILGRVLAAQSKLNEAEPLLIEACTRMDGGEGDPVHLRNALQALIALQEGAGRAEEAAPWREVLANLPPSATSRPAAGGD